VTVDIPACMTCTRFHRKGPLTCDAFPERIPDKVWLEGDPHTSPIEGDHGLLYEAKPGAVDVNDDGR
jgi:hypothetical protein